MRRFNKTYIGRYDNENVKFDPKYDKQKIEFIERELAGEFQKGEELSSWPERLCTLICGLSKDELKLKYILDSKYKSYFFSGYNIHGESLGEKIRAEIVASLDSDKEKIRLIPTFNNSYCKDIIYKSISSDKRKMELFAQTGNLALLASMSSDELKLFFMDHLGYEGNRTLIRSLKTDARDYRAKLEFPEWRDLVSLKSNEEKLRLYKRAKHDITDGYELIASLTGEDGDAEKIKLIDRYIIKHNKFQIVYLVKSLYSDDIKQRYIEMFMEKSNAFDWFIKYDSEKYQAIAEIVASLDSTELKLEYLGKMKERFGEKSSYEKWNLLIISSHGRKYSPRVIKDPITSINQLSQEIRMQLNAIIQKRYDNVNNSLDESADKIREHLKKLMQQMNKDKKSMEDILERKKAIIGDRNAAAKLLGCAVAVQGGE